MEFDGRWNNLASLEDMIWLQFGEEEEEVEEEEVEEELEEEEGGHEKMAGELRDESVQKILLLVTD